MFIVALIVCGVLCCVFTFLPRGVVDWSVVCDCGIFLSCSLPFWYEIDN